MNKVCGFVLLLGGLLLGASAHAQSEIVLEGIYQNQALFIQNPLWGASGEYCINEVTVNGDVAYTEPYVSALALQFKGFALNAPIRVVIRHKNNCQPRILNPGAVVFKSELSFDRIFIGENFIQWVSQGEGPEGTYLIERFVDGDWAYVTSQKARGEKGIVTYKVSLRHEPGANLYRIVYQGVGGARHVSQDLEHLMHAESITFSPRSVDRYITLSKEAFYEVTDADGNQITKGIGTKVDLGSLTRGSYIIIIEGQPHDFYKN